MLDILGCVGVKISKLLDKELFVIVFMVVRTLPDPVDKTLILEVKNDLEFNDISVSTSVMMVNTIDEANCVNSGILMTHNALL